MPRSYTRTWYRLLRAGTCRSGNARAAARPLESSDRRPPLASLSPPKSNPSRQMFYFIGDRFEESLFGPHHPRSMFVSAMTPLLRLVTRGVLLQGGARLSRKWVHF